VTQGGGGTEADVAHALELLDLARRRFVNVAGHELRTPITTIRGLAEQIPTASEAEMRDEIAPALMRSTRRLERLLDDLLIAAEITTALPVGEPEEVDIVATAVAIWDAGGDEELLVDGDIEATAMLRPGAADRLLEHVLENARRYGDAPYRLSAKANGDHVVIEVTSGGAEVAPDDLALAFELFYRGEGAVTSAPGFGLGLPVARALARQDGGDVRIAAAPGGGVMVTVELPASRAGS
jgi:signal transduction histidine kinase